MEGGISELCSSSAVDLQNVMKVLHGQILKDNNVTVESILANVSTYKLLEQTVACVAPHDPTLESSSLLKLLESIITEVCLPALEALEPSYDGREVVMLAVLSVCDLLSVCHARTGGSLGTRILTSCLTSLRHYHSEKSGPSATNSDWNKSQSAGDQEDNRKHLDIHCIIEVLRSLLSGAETSNGREEEKEMGALWNSMYAAVLSDLELCSVKLSSRLVNMVISKMLKLSPEKRAQRMADLWDRLKNITKFPGDSLDKETENKHQKSLELPLMVLCSLADYYFPEDGKPCGGTDIRTDPHMWQLVQRGLCHSSSEARKRSLYLLKRVVDICECTKADLNTDDTTQPPDQARRLWWSKASQSRLSKVWEDFLLLIETLEEKQSHIIKPVLPRFKNLLAAATPDNDGVWYLHTSWLVSVIDRCFIHECSCIPRWAAVTVLSINFQSVPFLQQGQDKFLAGTLLYRLQDLKLYSRPPGAALGTCSPTASAMSQYFSSLFLALPSKQQQEALMQRLLRTIISSTWGSIPLMFIFQGLARVPPMPILSSSALTDIREIVITNFSTLDLFTRGALLCFLTQTIIHLIDKDSASVTDLARTLAILDREESLQRGTSLWGECVAWLRGGWAGGVDSHPWGPVQFRATILSMCAEYLKKSTVPDRFASTEVTAVARLLMLACDAGLYRLEGEGAGEGGSNALGGLLAPSVGVLSQINSHAYMSPVQADHALNFLATLALELGTGKKSSDIDTAVRNSVQSCWADIVSHIQRRITEDIKEMEDLPVVELYTSALQLLAPLVEPEAAASELLRLTRTCIACLQHLDRPGKKPLSDQMVRVSAMSVLGVVGELQGERAPVSGAVERELCDFALTMQLDPTFASQTQDSMSVRSLGRLASQYMGQQWRCLHFLIRCRPQEAKAGWLLAASLEAFSVSSGEADEAILACITTALPQLLETADSADLVRLLETSWTKVLEDVRVNAFWSKLETLVSLCVQPATLLSPLPDVRNCVIRLMAEIFKLGLDKSGVVNVLVSQLCKVFAGEGGIAIALNHVHILADACMFGNIHKKTQRLWLDTCAYVESLDSQCSVNELISNASKADNLVRMTVTKFLLQLQPGDASHCRLADALLWELIGRYHQVSDQREFINSLPHRQRNRVVQILLVLQPFITQDTVDWMWEFLWRALASEPHQSIRFLLEWLVLLLVHRLPGLVDRLLQLYDEFEEKRTVCLCSLMMITSQLGPRLAEAERPRFYQRLLERVMPWCLANHYNTRIYSTATLSKVWSQCLDLGLTGVTSANPMVATCVKFAHQNRSANKNVQKMLDGFFMHTFDFQRDYSLETIFLTLLDLCGMSDEEWIPPRVFLQHQPPWDAARLLPIANPSPELCLAPRTFWRLRINEDDEDKGSSEGDVQKKIMPWRVMERDTEELQVEQGVRRKMEARTGGLVLVTSLIDKVPNLGGLCRTSEIFGVSEYAIRNLKFVEDRVFQSLSVTAHKWVPIVEVTPSKLPEYLEEKRAAGFTLVGVEQTANSVCLTEFQFPENTLLLLGNEKEGIPANLLPCLDVCVEIPQEGLIRSLNVHVSGAILVWEYRRQQLAKKS